MNNKLDPSPKPKKCFPHGSTLLWHGTSKFPCWIHCQTKLVFLTTMRKQRLTIMAPEIRWRAVSHTEIVIWWCRLQPYLGGHAITIALLWSGGGKKAFLHDDGGCAEAPRSQSKTQAHARSADHLLQCWRAALCCAPYTVQPWWALWHSILSVRPHRHFAGFTTMWTSQMESGRYLIGTGAHIFRQWLSEILSFLWDFTWLVLHISAAMNGSVAGTVIEEHAWHCVKNAVSSRCQWYLLLLY